MKKEANIDINVYKLLLDDIIKLYNTYNGSNNNKYKRIAVDGVYNNHVDKLACLNMGYFNIDDNVPVDITINSNNRNGEVKELMIYIYLIIRKHLITLLSSQIDFILLIIL